MRGGKFGARCGRRGHARGWRCRPTIGVWRGCLACKGGPSRQARDNALRKMADRIQARAVKRCGELLKQFNGKGRNQYTDEDRGGTSLTQKRKPEDALACPKSRSKRQYALPMFRPTNSSQRLKSDDPPTRLGPLLVGRCAVRRLRLAAERVRGHCICSYRSKFGAQLVHELCTDQDLSHKYLILLVGVAGLEPATR
jgi:hypothetical protein